MAINNLINTDREKKVWEQKACKKTATQDYHIYASKEYLSELITTNIFFLQIFIFNIVVGFNII